MPVKVWDRSPDGNFTSSIRTTRRTGLFRGEAFREEAEELDRHLDRMLDRAVQLTSSAVTQGTESEAFVKRWALGRAVAEEEILEFPHLEPDERKDLWTAWPGSAGWGCALQENWRRLGAASYPTATRIQKCCAMTTSRRVPGFKSKTWKPA